MHCINLDLLGTRIDVICKYEACANEIKEHFGSHVVALTTSTPDVIIECDWPNADKYLFRSRPESITEPLTGIKVSTRYETIDEWVSCEPPIPPFICHPFAERFVGVHAACLRNYHEVGVMLVGDRGSGKTTISLELANQFGWPLLTDEVVCIIKRTTIVEPFAIAMGIKANPDSQKKTVPADKLCKNISKQPVMVKNIVFLNNIPNSSLHITKVEHEFIFKTLLKHHLHCGCNLDESLATLHRFAAAMSGYVVSYSGYAAKHEVAAKIKALTEDA